MAAGLDDGLGVVGDAEREETLAQVQPNALDRIELRAVGRQLDQGETVGEELRTASVEVCSPRTRLAAQRPFIRKIRQQTEEIAMRSANQKLNRSRQPNALSCSAYERWYLGNPD